MYREKLRQRKLLMADQAAEERRRLAAKNFSEGRKRYSERKRKEVGKIEKERKGRMSRWWTIHSQQYSSTNVVHTIGPVSVA